MRKTRTLAYVFLCVLFSVPFWGARNVHANYHSTYIGNLPSTEVDSVPVKKNVLANKDSIRLQSDSLLSDSIPKKKEALDAIVDYSANDSIILTGANLGYLYGEAEISYTTIKLKSEKITMNMDSSLVFATFGTDSIGKEFGFPVFSDGGTDYESKTMKYNFKSKKGYIRNVITKQGEGIIVADQAKKNPDNSFFMCGGRYSTCDNPDHPHFYLALTKAKVRPKKDVVTGPAYLVVEGLPIPLLGLPFAYFPFSDSYSSGIIMPSYGDEMERGFNLHDGGYYFAINDNVDLSITGDIYTKGSWGLKAQSSYNKRYKYSGSVRANYLVNKYGDKDDPDYSISKAFSLDWSHQQDPKSNMFRTLSANVQFSTSSYGRSSLDQKYTPRGTEGTKASTINLNQRIPNSPWSFNASASIMQTVRDSSIAMTLPNLTITMSQIYPFKRKQAVGEERWYEKIRLSYSGDLRNSINTKEDKLLKSNLIKDWKNGMQHRIPISATFNAFNYINITPSVNYNERWYTSKIEKSWDATQNRHIDTTYHSFGRSYDFNTSISAQTKLYGFFRPLFSKTTQIRHVFSPSVSLGYAPDFSSPIFGSYKSYQYYDANGILQTETYSPYEKGMFSPPSKGKQGTISFSFDNNIEMKVASKSDTTGFKKISIIDQLGINFSHNMMAESFKWSDINTNIRLKLSKSLTINLNATFDPYMYKEVNGKIIRVDELRIKNGKGFGRLKSTGYSFSPNINQDTFKKWFGKDEDKDNGNGKKKNQTNDPEDDGIENDMASNEGNKGESMLSGQKDDKEYDADGYVKNQIKWSLGLNFSMNYGYDSDYNRPTIENDPRAYVEYKGKLTKSLSFNGNIQPTRDWNFNFSATYDFDAKKIPYMTCNLTRNLHCWSISANINPIGDYKSYYVSLRASSSLLQDLKYEQRGRGATSYDPTWD